MVNPRQVEAFRAVMLTGGITAAAALLNVSQPAVSRLIRDLQESLDLPLFERRGARLLPTGEALALYREVERSFVGLDRIAQAAIELRERRAGVLRIAALPALANGYLPRFAGRFLAARPRLDLALFGLGSHLVLDWVATGQCDVGFAQIPIEHPTVTLERLPPIPAVAAIPAGHPLARKRRLRPSDFGGEPFISLEHSTLLRYRIDAVFADHGVERQLRVETPLSMIACALATAAAGLAIVDPFTADEFVGRGIVILPFEPRIDVEFGILHSTQGGLSGIAQEFIDEFRDAVAAFGREVEQSGPRKGSRGTGRAPRGNGHGS